MENFKQRLSATFRLPWAVTVRLPANKYIRKSFFNWQRYPRSEGWFLAWTVYDEGVLSCVLMAYKRGKLAFGVVNYDK